MALTASQINVLRNPAFRQHWPAQAQTFVQVDKLCKTYTDQCPRVAAIWTMLMSPAQTDLALWNWFTTTFPGVPMIAGGNSYAQPGTTAVPALTAQAPTPVKHPLIQNAIDVIQSYRKR